MADAIFTACFLNECNRNCDLVQMANFAPIVNTRGCIYTHENGIVLRSTYYIFDLYVNYLGDVILDSWCENIEEMEVQNKSGQREKTNVIDVVASSFTDRKGIAIAVVNKDALHERDILLNLEAEGTVEMYYISGDSTEAYNDIGHEGVRIENECFGVYEKNMRIKLKPHMAGVIQIGVEK